MQVLSVCKIMCKTSFGGSENASSRSRRLFRNPIKSIAKPVRSDTKCTHIPGYLPHTGKYYSDRPRWEIEIVPFAAVAPLLRPM